MTIKIVIVFLAMMSGAFAATDEVRLAQFLAGMELVRSAPPDSTQVTRYKLLKTVTGLDSAKVISMIAGYKNDPAGWTRVQQKVREILEVE